MRGVQGAKTKNFRLILIVIYGILSIGIIDRHTYISCVTHKRSPSGGLLVFVPPVDNGFPSLLHVVLVLSKQFGSVSVMMQPVDRSAYSWRELD